MDSMELLYALYLSYEERARPKLRSLNFMEFQERLCHLLIQDDEGCRLLMKTANEYEDMVNTQAQRDMDEKLDFDEIVF